MQPQGHAHAKELGPSIPAMQGQPYAVFVLDLEGPWWDLVCLFLDDPFGCRNDWAGTPIHTAVNPPLP